MNSRVRVFTIIAVSIAVPVLAIWQRWSEVRVFARQFQAAFSRSADTGNASSQSGSASKLSASRVAGEMAAAGDWQGAIGVALSSNGEPAVVSARLLELLPKLPEAGRSEAVQHLANLLPDADYGPMVQLLASPTTSGEIQDLLLADLFNRSNGVKLPALLEVARTPHHTKAKDARQVLQIYLEEDFGDDWAKCQTKLELWLKEHPDS